MNYAAVCTFFVQEIMRGMQYNTTERSIKTSNDTGKGGPRVALSKRYDIFQADIKIGRGKDQETTSVATLFWPAPAVTPPSVFDSGRRRPSAHHPPLIRVYQNI